MRGFFAVFANFSVLLKLLLKLTQWPLDCQQTSSVFSVSSTLRETQHDKSRCHMVLIKTLFYTGVRVSELVTIRLDEVDVDRCQIRITQGKGSKDRQVPFPLSFRELLALHIERMHEKGASFLFESVRKKKYTDRGIRKMLARYATQAGITRSMSPHKWRHFLFTWLKKDGIDDALIQPYSGHATRQSLEVYSKLSLADAQPSYNQAMERFPIQ